MSSGITCSVHGCTYNWKKLKEMLNRPCFEHFPKKRSQCSCAPPYAFFKMPTEDGMKKQWLAALQRKFPPKTVYVCSFHFIDKKPTKENPVPELYLGYENVVIKRRLLIDCDVPSASTTTSTSDFVDNKRRVTDSSYASPKIENQLKDEMYPSSEDSLSTEGANCSGQPQIENEIKEEISPLKEEIQEVNESNEDPCIKVEAIEELIPQPKVIAISGSSDASTQWVDFSLMDHQYTNLTADDLLPINISSQTETVYCRSFAVQYSGPINIFETIIESNGDSLFYTGLPKTTLLTLIKCVEQYACPSFQMSVSDQILMILMKLKLNLMTYDISRRFGVSLSLVSRMFSFWLDTLAVHLKHLIVWLPKETVAAIVPDSFRARYPKTSCIISCMETQIENTSCLDCIKETNTTRFRKPKNTTCKYLVAIAPAGPVMFVSSAYRGEISDSFITSDCGVLNNLIPGDEVMANHQFAICDLLSERKIALNVTTCAKEKNIKCAIRRMKMFKILSDKMPARMVSKMSKILQICGALVNMLPEISKDNTLSNNS